MNFKAVLNKINNKISDQCVSTLVLEYVMICFYIHIEDWCHFTFLIRNLYLS